MTSTTLGRGLATGVGAIAVLNTVSSLAMPVRDRAPATLLVVTWLLLISAHATLYWVGDRIRGRFELRAYAMAQAAVLFAIALARVAGPVTLGLFMACTAELIVLAGDRWGTIRIILGAIALFVLASLITSDLYRATTAGLLLAVTGVIAHAVSGLVRRPSMGAATEREAPAAAVSIERTSSLSSREIEVLRELVRGARNRDIATKLGITERTVKAHLGSIYQKLGVESRSAAVAMAVQRSLV
jgi:DNA-binding CsgD family transcriptional regulator